MLSGVNWKPYLIGAAVATIISVIFSWRVAAGFLIGTAIYFLNGFLNLKKFPNLNDGKGTAIGIMLGIMAAQGLLTIVAAVSSWLIGRLPSFISCFVALIAPSVYFFIVGSKK